MSGSNGVGHVKGTQSQIKTDVYLSAPLNGGNILNNVVFWGFILYAPKW